MSAEIIDGKQIAAQMRLELKQKAVELKEKGMVPGLGVILVGDDPASKSYVTAKERACEEIGIYSDDNRLPASTSQAELMALVQQMNNDPKIHGILVQLPLPKQLNESEVLFAIDPDKDVDGFHPVNVGRMMIGESGFLPCTPHGVVQMLVRSNVTIEGAHAVEYDAGSASLFYRQLVHAHDLAAGDDCFARDVQVSVILRVLSFIPGHDDTDLPLERG